MNPIDQTIYETGVFYVWFVIGIGIGFGARLLLPERFRLGVMLEMTLGMVGAFGGGLAASAFAGSWAEFGWGSVLGCVAGALGLTIGTGLLLREEGVPGDPFPD